MQVRLYDPIDMVPLATIVVSAPTFATTAGDSIELSPGQSTTGTVVIDVPSQHGQLYYEPDTQPYGVWSF